MYVLVNDDGSVNFADDHPVNPNLCFERVKLIELPDKTLADMVGDIRPEEALWDDQTQTMIRHPYFDVGSEIWRQRQASIKINTHYPIAQQLNILRESDKAEKRKMVAFIDACRSWSNDLDSDPEAIFTLLP